MLALRAPFTNFAGKTFSFREIYVRNQNYSHGTYFRIS